MADDAKRLLLAVLLVLAAMALCLMQPIMKGGF